VSISILFHQDGFSLNFTIAVETSYSPQPLSICFKTFQELILKHRFIRCALFSTPLSLFSCHIYFSVESPPFAIAVFDLADVNAITNHMINTYFRHLKLYQYVFGTTKELELLTHPAQAQQVNMTRIPPLSSATSSEAPEQQEESGQQSEIQVSTHKAQHTILSLRHSHFFSPFLSRRNPKKKKQNCKMKFKPPP